MTESPKTPYDKWKDTIDDARTNTAWNGYDNTIRQTVNAYNLFLQKTKGFKPLDWKLVKAIVWTETGGPYNPVWQSNPMQIGNSGDPGLKALLSGKEGGELIMPQQIAIGLTVGNATTQPEKNIQAGVGYLLMRTAKFEHISVEDPTDTVRDYAVKPGESLATIAARNDSTLEELKALNPHAHVLHPGQVIKIRKASIQMVITGYRTIDSAMVAARYNTKNKHDYAKKLDYCLSIMK